MSVELKIYCTNHGHKTVLVGPAGRKLIPILLMESSGLTVVKVPLIEQRYLSDPPPLKRAKSINTIVRQFRAFGNRVGMTKAAKLFLKQATAA